MSYHDANLYIAGWKTAADWAAFRGTLVIGGDAGTWQRAFQEYFRDRLDLRYLNPIRILQEHGTFQGEGFSILAIQSTLIEFLESTVQGVNYRYLRPGEKLGPYEYSSSSEVFASFLRNRHPFARDFDEALAREFYREIRCGLLHEARTKGEWKVWAEAPDGTVVDRAKRIVYRNNFQDVLDQFIRWYEAALPHDAGLQEAFIRKFNNLCE
ncbi:MAG: hypothetical protein HY574_03955 [candidate division NC10 bacterium]|nr:hypothetical protein [candidate division NC10 bacterium]